MGRGPSSSSSSAERPGGRSSRATSPRPGRRPDEHYGSGVSHAGAPTEERDSHVLLLCRDEEHRRSSLAAWIQRGLDRGEKVLCTDQFGATALTPLLLEHQLDVTVAMGTGRLSVLSLEDFYPRGGPEVLVRAALDEGYPRVRLAVRAEAALGHLGADGYRSVERQIDRLCASLPVS